MSTTDNRVADRSRGQATGGKSPSHPITAVVVPTRNRIVGLRRTVDALEHQTLPYDQFEVVLVDDGSEPPVAEDIDRLVAASPLAVRVVHHPQSKGQAAARNTGWATTCAEIVAFTDDDCIPDPMWLEKGVAAFAAARVGVVQGRTIRPETSDEYRYTPFTVVREVSRPSPWFEGCNIFYRREALEESGGFDEFAGTYGEDTSLGWEVLRCGWDRDWAEDAVVQHELSERPWAWHLWFHWRESTLVSLAARYPDLRSWFWRPWAVKRENALFAMAVGGLVVSLRKPLAVATVGPYLAWLGPGRKVGPTGAALQISAHAASLAGKLAAGVRSRAILL